MGNGRATLERMVISVRPKERRGKENNSQSRAITVVKASKQLVDNYWGEGVRGCTAYILFLL